MDTATLAQAMGSVSGVNYAALTAACNEAMIAAGCTNPARAAMWCAQIGHESVGLKFMREIGGPAYFARYNNRADLGNGPSDGPRYPGRGPIQLTGKHNYGRFSEWCAGRGLVPSSAYFVLHPTMVEEPRWGFLAASWYWVVARPLLNTYSDRADLNAATRAINGGTNGWADRQTRYNRCRLMGARLLPDPNTPGEDDDMTPEQAKQLAEVHAALTRQLKPWAGGLSNKEATRNEDPNVEAYSLPQYVLRDNVEVRQMRKLAETISAKLDALAARFKT